MLHPVGYLKSLPDGKLKTGPVSPVEFFSILQKSEVVLWESETIKLPDKSEVTVYYQKVTPGSQVLRPGETPPHVQGNPQ